MSVIENKILEIIQAIWERYEDATEAPAKDTPANFGDYLGNYDFSNDWLYRRPNTFRFGDYKEDI